MTVTDMVDLNKKQSKVFLDGSFAFVLYKGEIRKYALKIGTELKEEDYQEIVTVILVKRSKLRAMHLLKSMDRTEKQLRDKLKDGGYPPDVIDTALDYVKGYGYIDDHRYASNYIRTYRESKSQKRIMYELEMRGIPKDLYGGYLEDNPADEMVQIEKWLKKKRYSNEDGDFKIKQKMAASLARKGFSYDNIQRALGNTSIWE